jgi:L-alanine-DL-glutamate epimerase-like enolase superfamily enzyme
VATAERVRPQELLRLGEPVSLPEDAAGLARIRAGIAIAAGANAANPEERMALMRAAAVDYVQPSVARIGGFGAWMRVAQAAPACGGAAVPQCPGFGPGFVATLHMVASLPGESLIEHTHHGLAASPFTVAIQPQRGRFALPAGPGLGCEPGPDTLRRYAA